MPPNSSQIQHMNAVEGPARRPTEEDKAEKIKRKLEQRKIPAENWHFYIEAPELWDFDDIAKSERYRGSIIVAKHDNTRLGREGLSRPIY